MPKGTWGSWLAGMLAVAAVVGCSPPDKPFETVQTRRNTVTPLSVPDNPGVGYSYYLTARLLQAQYILETALNKGEPLLASASENKKCRRTRLLNSNTSGRQVFYFQYRNCETQDERAVARIFGEERFELTAMSRGTEPANAQVLQHLSFTTEDLTVELKPRAGVAGVLKKTAELNEQLTMVADLVESSQYTDEQGVNQWEDKYSFYFRTVPNNRIFQDLVLGDMTALDNASESLQIFGMFVVRNGRVSAFVDGELRYNSSGSRKVRSKDKSVDFSKHSTAKVVLATLADKPLVFGNTCVSPIGRLRRVTFEVPVIANPPAEDGKAAKAYDLAADGFVDIRTGHKLGWSGCLAENWGRSIPYGHVFLR